MNANFEKVKAYWKTRKGKVVISIGTLLFLCICCGAITTLFPPKSKTSSPPTMAIEDVVALAMTSVIETNVAAYTPTPPATATPTETPLPTSTSTPPPQPITLTGSGDSIVDVSKWDGPAIMRARYSGGSNFVIQNYGPGNERIDLLVNEIGSYDGIVPVDFLDNESTIRLEIKASGPWELLISPLTDAKKYDLPVTINGVGDDVVILRGGNADLIKANSQGDSNFAVWSYGTSGRDLVFNDIAPYTGTALLSPDTFVLVITATGNWSLEITTK